MKHFFTSIRKFLVEDLWKAPLHLEKGVRFFIARVLRSILYAMRGFYEDLCLLRASALTYYTLMTLVPVVAMLLAIAQAFGYQESLEELIRTKIMGEPALIQKLLEFSDNLIRNTKGGLIAGVGLIILFWSVIKILSHAENALNHIWEVKRARRFVRKFSDYLALMIIAPIFFIGASSVTLYIVSKLQTYIEYLPLYEPVGSSLVFLVKLIPYALIWVLFTFIYLFLPNTKVHFLSAIIGGIIGGTLYQFAQWAYIYFQIGLSSYGAIYGSFAAIPLFLIWLDLSWLCVLFGAEISHTFQTIESYEFGWKTPKFSWRFDLMVQLWIMHQAVLKFQKGEFLTRQFVRKKLRLPLKYVNKKIDELIASHMLTATSCEKQVVPATDTQNLRVKDVIEALFLQEREEGAFWTEELSFFHKVLDDFFIELQKGQTKSLFKEIPYHE